MIHRAINIIQSMDNTWLKFVKSQTKMRTAGQT